MTASNDQKLKFRKSCLNMLKAVVEELQERCPLQYLVIRNASCLAPTTMITQPEVSKLQFNSLVDKLYSCKWLSEKSSEEAKLQFEEFLSLPCKQNCEKFSQFKWEEQRIDEFLGAFLHRNEKYQAFRDVCKEIFVLSHGQSSIERGFSVNKDLLVENLNLQSLIGQRTVYDYFFSSDLSKSCKSAYSRYKAALDEKSKRKFLLTKI